MQTVEPYVEVPSGQGPRRPGRTGARLVLAFALLLPLSLLLVSSKWGVIVAAVAAAGALVLAVVFRQGLLLTEVAAFLIHFDGMGTREFNVGRAMALVVAAVLLYKLLVERWRPPAVPARHWVPVMVITTMAVFTGAWVTASGKWFFNLGVLGLALAYFALTGFLVDSHQQVERFMRAFWIGGLFGTAAAIAGLAIGKRGAIFGGDPNFLGLLQASMIPLTVYYRRRSRTDKEKWFYTFALLFVLGGVAGAGSRSGVIGASLVIVATIVTRPGLGTGQRAKVGAGAVVAGALAFVVLFVANPANTARGFTDRGAGRLDLWNATTSLIGDRPLFGHGFGQIVVLIPERLPSTPGVQGFEEAREAVSAHNTWLDVTGDLGLVGLVVFLSIYVVTIFGFLRPRWRQTKQLSTTLLLMMIPVLSSSQFLGLLNNKLAWSLIGLSAALQVPSWGARWKGYFATPGTAIVPVRNGTPARSSPTGAELPPGATAPGGATGEDWQSTTLARWDLRVSRRFRVYLLAGAAIGFVLFGSVASRIDTRYTATGDIVVPVLDGPANTRSIVIESAMMQHLYTLVLSNAYAAELQRLSGVELSPSEISRHMKVERPQFSAYMRIIYSDPDQARTEQVSPYLIDALDAVFDRTREATSPVLEDEVRPMYPGEQRYYTGPMYLRVSDEITLGTSVPRVGWASFVGAFTGVMVGAGAVLLQQRRPRVNNDDDFPSAVGMPLWTHVGRPGGRNAASAAQYAHLAVTAFEAGGTEEMPRRITVASPLGDRSTRSIATGLAAALAASGHRVVLVDGHPERPWLTARLGGLNRAGLVDVVSGRAELASTVRRVSRWRLRTAVRRTLGRAGEKFRFVPAGRAFGRGEVHVEPSVLDALDRDVVVVLLAPPLLGTVPASPALRWADVVLYCLVEGATPTSDAEDAALQVRTFAGVPAGVVLADV